MSFLDALFDKYKSYSDFLDEPITDVNQMGIGGDYLIHVVSRQGTVEELDELIKHGVNLDQVGELGYTALHYAAMQNDVKKVNYLLSKGANPNIRSDFNELYTDMHQYKP